MPVSAFWLLAVRLGKMRYLITGTALAVLFGLICRGAGKLLCVQEGWQRFTGTVRAAENQNDQTVLTADFTDSRRMQHTVCFPVEEQEARALQTGTQIHFAMQRTLFESGTYPRDPAGAQQAAGKILLHSTYHRVTGRQLLRELLRQFLIWTAAAALCAVTVRLCFPKP